MKNICVALIAIFVLFIVGCGICKDEVLSQRNTPDGKVAATVFVRDCGATADYSSVVSLHAAGRSFRNQPDWVFIAKGKHSVIATWTSSRQLLISCSTCTDRDVFKKVVRDGGVDIVYE
jgi:hypothetical protein